MSRTGTLSLKHALETLSCGRCYHFVELLKRGHSAQWLAILDGAPPNWEKLFAGYTAAVDYPAVAYYRELADAYPKAKVILTVRDPDEWHASICGALLPLRRSLDTGTPWGARVRRLTDRILWDGTFEGRAAERDFAVARFHAHNDEVRAVIAPERLLVFDVREGWEPLCRFLGCPVPDVPFPSTNSRRRVRTIARLLRGARFAAAALLVVLAAFAVMLAWR